MVTSDFYWASVFTLEKKARHRPVLQRSKSREEESLSQVQGTKSFGPPESGSREKAIEG
jgi:hypothetical protein